MPIVLEELQRVSPAAEIWWDSSPLDFPRWRRHFLNDAPDQESHHRWSRQLDRFLCPEKPDASLVRGITTNPSLVAKSILASPETWRAEIRETIRSQSVPDVESTFRLVYEEALRRAAARMLPMWEASGGRFGWVSGQLDPRLMFNADLMLEQALRIARIAPNLMVKVPGSAAGYEVIRQLVARGTSVNNTLSYTVPQFLACAEAVESGLAEARRRGVATDRWRAVFTHMTGRFGANTDLRCEAAIRGMDLTPSEIRWAEVAILKRVHRRIAEHGHPVKLLLSSLEVENPAAGSGALSMHLEESAGGAIAYTCKPRFVADVMRRDHELPSFAADAIEREVPARVLEKLMWLPSFHRAYDPQGMGVDEFAHYGSFIETYAEVLGNTRKLLDFIAHQLQTMSDSARPLLLSGSTR
ncbi:transaldolase family protein [Streptomyces sp. NPDC051773]|uniref:transaldolase family protein n=1 Tax=Streptomyces sp. NPDC051773 TaxID=3156682 RepID=UPI00342BF044